MDMVYVNILLLNSVVLHEGNSRWGRGSAENQRGTY